MKKELEALSAQFYERDEQVRIAVLAFISNETCCFYGPAGSGKRTLAALIVQPPQSDITIVDGPVPDNKALFMLPFGPVTSAKAFQAIMFNESPIKRTPFPIKRKKITAQRFSDQALSVIISLRKNLPQIGDGTWSRLARVLMNAADGSLVTAKDCMLLAYAIEVPLWDAKGLVAERIIDQVIGGRLETIQDAIQLIIGDNRDNPATALAETVQVQQAVMAHNSVRPQLMNGYYKIQTLDLFLTADDYESLTGEYQNIDLKEYTRGEYKPTGTFMMRRTDTPLVVEFEQAMAKGKKLFHMYASDAPVALPPPPPPAQEEQKPKPQPKQQQPAQNINRAATISNIERAIGRTLSTVRSELDAMPQSIFLTKEVVQILYDKLELREQHLLALINHER